MCMFEKIVPEHRCVNGTLVSNVHSFRRRLVTRHKRYFVFLQHRAVPSLWFSDHVLAVLSFSSPDFWLQRIPCFRCNTEIVKLKHVICSAGDGNSVRDTR